MTDTSPLIDAKGLEVKRGAHVALRDVDFVIRPGEIVTIVGPNGSGKSTLLRALIGAIQPSAGRIRRKPGLRIGYVPQSLHVEPGLPLTVARFLKLPTRHSKKAIKDALEYAGLPDLHDRQMSALSGGQFQRVLLARALLEKPDILMLDEPTQGLDQRGSAEFYRQIEAVRRELNCAVLMVSHELHVVMSASDRVICLNGHVCCSGTPEIVATAPEYRALFGTGTKGALALYRHTHDHAHDHDHPQLDHHHEDHAI
ncbi:metal ABC transporter ATP-binding protein [Aliiruegeria sabulilitoris]|uniref:metal ABC transporter ATP-binding protein n=1 Tax=Aliiruegeria sabulilitoris TaxID=1510458 RepID=UPI000833F8C4|nr:metal ABC transporter ATP-binding protein [Aliiruegeria sabulilitoris]NDR58512.1 metal ABC transporter ATP-binding protein [Pseudoruegeria sp. M32A2M]